MTIDCLTNAAIGAPITRIGVSFFPLYLPGLSSDLQILDGSVVSVIERPSASVPEVIVENSSESPALVTAGSLIQGGQQNRTLNVSVLVPPRSMLDVPVSCVEAGRWSGNHGFTTGEYTAPRRVRRAMQQSIAESLRQRGERRADQGVVWSQVASELNRYGVRSETTDVSVLREAIDASAPRRRALEELISRGPLAQQCGVVVCHGSRVVAAEVFISPALLERSWASLITSHLLEGTSRHRSRPSATRALRFVRGFARADSLRSSAVGLGEELHVDTDSITGQALVLDGAVVHASMFAVAA